MDAPLRMVLRVNDTDADDQQLDELARQLRDELMALDLTVEGVAAGEAPPSAKSVELAAVGALMLTLSQAPVLAAIIGAASSWLGQRRQRTVRLELGGDVLELSGQPSQEQRRAIDAWLRRHEPDRDAGLSVVGLIEGRHALIVANYDYQDPGLRRLRAPAHDAEQLARVLRDPTIGDFTVQTMLNESAPAINEAVEDFFADRSPDDLLVLYFTGHGVKDEDGELFFAAAPTKLSRLGATAVAADFVNRRMARSRSRRIVLLLDCCYAGAFGRGMIARAGNDISLKEQFGGHGRAVITATSAVEYAFEDQHLTDTREGGPSVFTTALVEGLDTGDADLDQDGYVGLDELYDYVFDRVRRSTPNQTPGKWIFDLRGDLHIARRSKPITTAATMPPLLQEAIDHPLSGVRAGAVGELERLLKGRHEGLALAARLALQNLVDDDSRTVSAAAARALGPAAPPAAAPAGQPAAVSAAAPATVPPLVAGPEPLSTGSARSESAQPPPLVAAPPAQRNPFVPRPDADRLQERPEPSRAQHALMYDLNLALSTLPILVGCPGGPVGLLGVPIAVVAIMYGRKAKRLFGAGDLAGARTALRRSRTWWITGAVVTALVAAIAIRIATIE
jgi:hypothetical protein